MCYQAVNGKISVSVATSSTPAPDVPDVESKAVWDGAVNVLTTSQAIRRDGSCHQKHQQAEDKCCSQLW